MAAEKKGDDCKENNILNEEIESWKDFEYALLLSLKPLLND